MLDLTQFKVISFDCYGTLIDWETGIFSALRPILAAHRKNLSDAQLLALYSELESEAEQREFRSYREVLKAVVRGYGRRLEFKPTEAEEESLPASLANWKPFPDTVAALRKLKAHFQLAVISNVDDDLFAATARRLEVPFDHLITAQQARAYKPSLKVFNLARQRIGIAPADWLHAAQSVYHDVVPAKSLGISTVWVNRPSPRPGAGAAKSATADADLVVPDLETLARMTDC